MSRWLTSLLLPVLLAVPASGSTIIRETDLFSVTFALKSTNWSGTLNIPKFDSSLGVLKGVYVDLFGHVEGTARFESEDEEPIDVAMQLAATLKLSRPSNALIVQVVPLVSTLDSVMAYDGTEDYLGASGRTYTGLSANAGNALWLRGSSDLALFSGTGDIVLPISASANSYGTGGGNLVTRFVTKASAKGSVKYEYEAEIPEPTSIFLIGSGLLGFAAYFRRRIA